MRDARSVSECNEAIQNRNVDCHESLRDSRNDEIKRNESTYNSHNDDKGQFESFHNNNSRFTPKFYFILGIVFNLCLLAFFKYTDFLLENFNAFSKLSHLDFNIPLPHILLPLALSFVTFQQIAFLFDCYKRVKSELNENLHIGFIDYALFISFFPQLIAGPIVHHREMMPQFASLSNSSSGSHCVDLLDFESSQTPKSSSLPKSSKNSTSTTTNTRIVESPSLRGKANTYFATSSLRDSTQRVESWQSTANSKIFDEIVPQRKSANESHLGVRRSEADLSCGAISQKAEFANYEFLAKGIFIFSIGLFKKAFIADSFAKWANAGFSVVESGGMLNIAESWATSLSYTFQLYFDFSGYCDMAIGLALMFGIVLPLNFDSPYKSLNISEFWRRWHITLGRFLKECVYIPLGGNRGKANPYFIHKKSSGSILGEKSGLRSHEQGNKTNGLLTKRVASLPDLSLKGNAVKILTLRNLFIVAFLSGIWHGAGWGFVIWGVLHGVAMVIHRIYGWWVDSLANYKKSSLRKSRSDSWQSKTSDYNQSQNIMSQKRIDESHKFTQSRKIINDSKVAKMDCFDLTSSSLTKQGEAEVSLVMTSGDSSLQGDLDTTSSLRGSVSEANTTKQSINHANQKIDCQIGKLAHNDEIMDCHDFAMQNLAMTSGDSSLRENPQGFSWQSTNTNNIDYHESLRDEGFASKTRNDEKMTKFLKSHNSGLFIRFTQTRFYKVLCWFITFNFVNLAWIFFRAENLNGAVNLIKGMFGFANLEIPHKWSKLFSALQSGTNEIIIWIAIAFIVCLALKNSFEMLKNFDTQYVRFRFSLRIFSKKIYLKGGAVWTRFVLTIALFYTSIWILLKNVLDSNAYTPFLYFNF